MIITYKLRRNLCFISGTLLHVLAVSETVKLEIMVSVIAGIVFLVIMYAAAKRMCFSRRGSHLDSFKERTFHVGKALFICVLYLFDLLSDVFLSIHYIAIGQFSNFLLVMGFTLVPFFFLSFMLLTVFIKPGRSCKLWCLWISGLVLLLVLSPLTILLPTIAYVKVC